jgi:hypothetical protein
MITTWAHSPTLSVGKCAQTADTVDNWLHLLHAAAMIGLGVLLGLRPVAPESRPAAERGPRWPVEV